MFGMLLLLWRSPAPCVAIANGGVLMLDSAISAVGRVPFGCWQGCS